MDPISLRVYAVLSLLVHCVSTSPIMGLEDDLPFYDEVLSEQDGVDFNSLLETMKDDFLKTLNLSGIPVQAPVKVEPPEYMLELYNKFATDRTTMPSANIVRSFKNEGKTQIITYLQDLFTIQNKYLMRYVLNSRLFGEFSQILKILIEIVIIRLQFSALCLLANEMI